MTFDVCSHCQSVIEIPDSWKLSTIKCDSCNQLFHIPGKKPHALERSKPNKKSLSNALVIAVLSVFGIAILTCLTMPIILAIKNSSFFQGSDNYTPSEPQKSYEEQQTEEKAAVMRRHGFTGSDENLAKVADDIKKLNELQKRQDQEDRDVLGN